MPIKHAFAAKRIKQIFLQAYESLLRQSSNSIRVMDQVSLALLYFPLSQFSIFGDQFTYLYQQE